MRRTHNEAAIGAYGRSLPSFVGGHMVLHQGGAEAGHPGPDEEAPSEVQSARSTASPPSSDCSMGFDT